MNKLTLFCILVILSCGVDNRNTFTKNDLIGLWKQGKPVTVQMTDIETGTKTTAVIDESFQFNADNTFSIINPFWRLGENGTYKFDEENQKVSFDLEGKSIFNGIEFVTKNKNEKWDWKIISFERNVLNVKYSKIVENDSLANKLIEGGGIDVFVKQQ